MICLRIQGNRYFKKPHQLNNGFEGKIRINGTLKTHLKCIYFIQFGLQKDWNMKNINFILGEVRM